MATTLQIFVVLIPLIPQGAHAVEPPPVTILQRDGPLADGFIFISPQGDAQADPAHPIGMGPEIVDDHGRPVWFPPVTGDQIRATDFRVQTYQGQPVLTWMQGGPAGLPASEGDGGYILDQSYRIIATVRAGNGLRAESHEFRLTPQNTALLSIYNYVTADLSSVGGSANAKVIEGVVQEVDVATGRVLLEWHSLAEVPVTESYRALPSAAKPNVAYDYFHLNSVSVDTDGNLLVSARHTSAVYKLNRTTGTLMWRLGGKRSDFVLGPDVAFAWQHDAIAVDADTIRLFDNASNGTSVLPSSRVIWVRRDETARTATLAGSITHPDGLVAAFMGGSQALENGATFVGWGSVGRFSEFDSSGRLVFDATLPNGYNSYRAYRFPWVGTPATSPTVTAQPNSDGTMTVHAIWNGATRVATWQVLGGRSASMPAVITTAAWNGLDTAIPLSSQVGFVQVAAVDAKGTILGVSPVLALDLPAVLGGTPVIETSPDSLTVAAGSTVTFNTIAHSAAAVAYQWSRNGTTIAGATHPRLVIAGVTPADAGNYACTVTNSAGAAITGAALLTVVDANEVSRLVNLSVLAPVGGESRFLTAGFVLGGADTSGSARLLIRAAGPALRPLGVAEVLADPALTLLNGGTPVARSDNWNSSPGNGAAVTAAAAAVGAFPFTESGSLDAALVATLPAQPYTVQVVGNGQGGGLTLVELYEVPTGGTADAPRLVNLSARGQISPGANLITAGFVVKGRVAKTILIRAIGPALRAFGVVDTLSDPQLTLHTTAGGGDMVIVANTGWNGDLQLTDTANRVGAFALADPTSTDAAVLVTLPPGVYTVEVASTGGASGTALVEIYEVP